MRGQRAEEAALSVYRQTPSAVETLFGCPLFETGVRPDPNCLRGEYRAAEGLILVSERHHRSLGWLAGPARPERAVEVKAALGNLLHEHVHAICPPEAMAEPELRLQLDSDFLSLPGWRFEEGVTEAATRRFLASYLERLEIPERWRAPLAAATYRSVPELRPLARAIEDLTSGLAKLTGEPQEKLLITLACERPGSRWARLARILGVPPSRVERRLRRAFFHRSGTAGEDALRRLRIVA